jgi:hypothetical protein
VGVVEEEGGKVSEIHRTKGKPNGCAACADGDGDRANEDTATAFCAGRRCHESVRAIHGGGGSIERQSTSAAAAAAAALRSRTGVPLECCECGFCALQPVPLPPPLLPQFPHPL